MFTFCKLGRRGMSESEPPRGFSTLSFRAGRNLSRPAARAEGESGSRCPAFAEVLGGAARASSVAVDESGTRTFLRALLPTLSGPFLSSFFSFSAGFGIKFNNGAFPAERAALGAIAGPG